MRLGFASGGKVAALPETQPPLGGTRSGGEGGFEQVGLEPEEPPEADAGGEGDRA
jgi:hypothetical protein